VVVDDHDHHLVEVFYRRSSLIDVRVVACVKDYVEGSQKQEQLHLEVGIRVEEGRDGDEDYAPDQEHWEVKEMLIFTMLYSDTVVEISYFFLNFWMLKVFLI
jgi:hypothetical protein